MASINMKQTDPVKWLDEYRGKDFTGTWPTLKEVFDMILYHAKKLCEFKGEYVGIREMRTHASFYLGGRPHAAKMRVKLCQIESLEELEEYLNSCLDSRG